MLRWLGAALILCGGLLARSELLERGRLAQRTRLSLASAFEAMSAEISLLLTPLPALLQRDYGAEADMFCASVLDGLESRGELCKAWKNASQALPLSEREREALALSGTRLECGEEGARSALALAAGALRGAYEAEEARRGENERLVTSVCICVSLFLTILLF